MSEIAIEKKIENAQLFVDDAIDSLVDNLSTYDEVYKKLDEKRRGVMARALVKCSAIEYAGELGSIDTDDNTLFPELEYEELESSARRFARATSHSYIHWLFGDGRFREKRIRNREVFPDVSGEKVCAEDYAKQIWAPRYAGELRAAAELGLTKKLAAEITGGVEAIS